MFGCQQKAKNSFSIALALWLAVMPFLLRAHLGLDQDQHHVWCLEHQQMEHRHGHDEPREQAATDWSILNGPGHADGHHACPLELIQRNISLISQGLLVQAADSQCPAKCFDTQPVLPNSISLLAQAPKQSPPD